MSVNIGTSLVAQATAFSTQRKLLKSSNGTLLLFTYLGDGVSNRIQYKTSSDDGISWSSWIDCSFGRDILVDSSHNFDVQIDSSDNIYIVSPDKYTNLYYEKLTYSGGSWSNGTPTYISGLSSAGQRPSILIRANGDIWIVTADRTYGAGKYLYSTDGGSSWSSSANTPNNLFGYGHKLIEVNGKIWCICPYYTGVWGLQYFIYDTSWDAGNVIVTGSTTDGDIGVVKISDTEVWVAARTSSGIKVFKYNGSTWDSGTLISDNANDDSPALSNVNSKPVVVWKDYDGSQYDVAYRAWNGSSWEAQVDITNDATADSYISVLESDNNNIYTCWASGSGSPYTIYFEKTLLVTEVLSDINNDFRSLKLFAFDDIDNDFRMVSTLSYYDITNDFRLSGATLDDIINDFRLGADPTIRIDINNDFRFIEPPVVTEVISDIFNLFNLVGDDVTDINNDIRTHKIELNNITNDFRLIADWQIPGDIGFQSLGKTYIKVYISSVEQTDANIDSVTINKVLNATHTATFDLGRAYDSSKPDIEAMVEIKYNDQIIYKGYIVDISPTDSPESIKISCNDKFWKQNKTKKYFHIGHKPQDDKDLYYNTIKEGLSSECSFTVDIGNFIPQTINCFGQGESNCINSLIPSAGNYAWFYKEDESKKLWEGGKGDIINIDAQSIGTNLGLHQILRHQFRENIESIVNKFRVQMGEKTIRTFDTAGGTKSYGGFDYRYYEGFASPDWSGTFEDTYGESAPDGTWEGKEDVFTKYSLPTLDSELESYTDRYLPQVELYQPGSYPYGFNSGIMEEGFTIDYKNKILIFNEPLFAYQLDSEGNVTSVRRPGVKLLLWKKKYYSYTSSPSENPETEVSNPLMFFTDKMGDYSETIIGNLDLSSLSIQEGYTFYWWRKPGYPKGIHYPSPGFIKEVEEHVPSWNDTEFAKDYADWELSKNCDKKINGSIDITLDTFLFYNIDLSKRIMINGVIDDPLNITSITINISNFTVTLELENNREYKRSISLQSRGE